MARRWMLRLLVGAVGLALADVEARSLPEGFPASPRQKTMLVDGWAFHLDKGEGGFVEAPAADWAWKPVTIPHALELTSLDKNGSTDDEYQLTFQRWVGWYARTLDLPNPAGKKVFLEFEGAHQVTKCWVNGAYAGEHAVGGYTPFHFDITAFVKAGKNEVLLSVDNRRNVNIPPEGDRYDYIKWGGLYRDVYLVQTDPVHVSFPWEETLAGVFVTTPTVSAEDATVSVRTQVQNESAQAVACTVVNRVVDTDGMVVLRLESEKTVSPNQAVVFTQTGGITENVRLWSPDDPYLYRVNTTVLVDGRVVDCIENPLGIRKIEFIDGRGFVLNGKNTELIGVNRHQSMLFIGDAVPNSLHWKDAWQFKQAGFNSVRLAHYPHDNSFIEACDQLGLLVYEEPPTWIGIGNEQWFDTLEEATRRMVRNHRNHPSVLMWAGSLNHRGPVERLHYACKEEDPTRPTASNGAPWTGPRGSGVCDIYSPMDYNNTPIPSYEFTYLCEHGTSANAYDNQFEVSKSRQMANMIGVACWVAHDYQSFKGRGVFSSGRPWSAFRVPNPVFYWYQSELTAAPMVHIADERASTDGQLRIFSNCQRIDLFNDGRMVESRAPDRNSNLLYLEHPTFTFEHDWKQGELVAKGFIDGAEAASHSRRKPGTAARIRLTIETDNAPFYANGSDIKFVQAELVDEHGTLVPNAEHRVRFAAKGAGEIVGDDAVGANPAKPNYGVATGYLRSGRQPGALMVTASAEGLESATASIETVPFENDRILAEARPIFEPRCERIDLSSTMETVGAGKGGGFEFGKHSAESVTSQFLQFGWTGWVGQDSNKVEHVSTVFPGCMMALAVEGGELDWYAHWGLVGNLPYLGIDGVRTKPDAKLVLTLSGLAKGHYRMTSYHHQIEELRKVPASLVIAVGDARDAKRVAVDGLRISAGSDLFNKAPASVAYEFESNGTDPVTVTFSSKVDSIGVVLNGFVLEEALP